MSKTYYLKNWYFYFNHADKWLVAYGNAFQNPKFYEGEWIHTSKIISVEVGKHCLRLHTLNSIYECLYETYAGPTMNFADIVYFPMAEPREENGEKVLEQIKTAKEIKLERDRKCVAEGVAAEDYCLVFEFSTEEEYYFKSVYVKEHGKEYYSTDYDIHVGMFQDSVLIKSIYEDYRCEFDYCFFPYAGNYVSFYSFTEFGGKIYVKNVGQYPLDVELPFGKFRIPPNSCYPVGEEVVQGRVTGEEKIAVDKHNLWDVKVYENGMVTYGGPRIEDGTPLFEVNEEVIFKGKDGTNIQGKIKTVNMNGPLEQKEKLSYSIFSEKENVLYQCVSQSDILARVGLGQFAKSKP